MWAASIGAVAGTVGYLAGYPFDTYKVLLQSGTPLPQKMTIRRLYQGASLPMFGRIVSKATFFGVADKIDTEKWYSAGVAGACSGTLTTFAEAWKIRGQVGGQPSFGRIYWLRGIHWTVARDAIFHAPYFCAYRYLLEKSQNRILAGGLTGMLCWSLCFPFDVLQTRAKSRPNNNNNGKRLVQAWGLTMVRAFCVHAITLTLYETLKKKLAAFGGAPVSSLSAPASAATAATTTTSKEEE